MATYRLQARYASRPFSDWTWNTGSLDEATAELNRQAERTRQLDWRVVDDDGQVIEERGASPDSW